VRANKHLTDIGARRIKELTHRHLCRAYNNDDPSQSNSYPRLKGVIETLAIDGYKELKKTGSFLVPGFAKFVVIKKPATKERAGINPFTKEPTVFKARPARKIVRARPVKAAKTRSDLKEYRNVAAARETGGGFALSKSRKEDRPL